MFRLTARRTLRLAVALLGLTAAAACSSAAPGSAAPAVPQTPSTVVRTVPITVTAPVTVTAVSTKISVRSTTATETATVTETLTPKPAGTRTEVRTSLRTATVTEKHTVTAAPPPPAGSFSDGTYLIGKDVKTGNYQASAPNPADGLCYWETRSSDGQIVDNGVNDGVLFIGSGAFSVRVSDCGVWKPAGQ